MMLILDSKPVHLVPDGNRVAHLVIGSVGEYSDRDEWVACIAPNEVAAKQIVIALSRDWLRVATLKGADRDREVTRLTMGHRRFVDQYDEVCYRIETAPYMRLDP